MNEEEKKRIQEDSPQRSFLVAAAIIITLIMFVLLGSLCTSCTISFQNISTHGTATDLVDENQTPENTVSPNIALPLNPI